MRTTPEICCCPRFREPLRFQDQCNLIGDPHGEIYPVVDGIPILLPDRQERGRVAGTDWSAVPESGGTAEFYNQAKRDLDYYRTSLGDTADRITAWLKDRQTAGPTLEIGSGRGLLQGVGDDYVALDYSLTALKDYIDPKYPRVCGTAECLPFRDNTFAFLFTVAALEHVPRADLAFEEIDRVLKPGGIAYLAPAWHCVQYNCEGIPVRPYRDLTLRQKWVKLTLPVRRNALAKALWVVPGRILRRSSWAVKGGPTKFRFKKLKPDYTNYWTADSDAAARLDAHEGCLFFRSREYDVLNPSHAVFRQILSGSIALVVRKPK